MASKLEKAREIINEVDTQMAELFVKRMRAAELVYEHKKEYGLPILDQNREDQVIASNSERIEDDVLKGYYIDYLKNLMSLSRAYQYRMQSGLKVAYSGVEGAFAHTCPVGYVGNIGLADAVLNKKLLCGCKQFCFYL